MSKLFRKAWDDWIAAKPAKCFHGFRGRECDERDVIDGFCCGWFNAEPCKETDETRIEE